ncbi:excinuclease ABC subunit UvrC [Microscilla marina]|uniref:UvrABC system protein C n=1 Tax=Microscilla marina ATCC 23134 TaxID=313606 RepID=A1ZTX2_MICM2|nr:excinuclease ABC subunit UvrC [Microscilla marina]EAY26224.1 excinuclease ABC, C subunit [Microscilla marina ATCC 23134]
MSQIEATLKQLPTNAGVYKFFDKNNVLLYVGKAKNLKNRVNSYFNKSAQHNRKTINLVKQIAHVDYTVVNSEFDALLLENNLIKNYQPKYNILLKDDKTYPYILITNEPFPKLVVTRKLEKNKGRFYGPFTNLKAMNAIVELIRELYTIRTCNLHLSKENIQQNKFKLCLEYHLGNCQAPCEGLQSEEDYLKDLEHAKHIMKGNIHIVKTYLKEQMLAYAEKLEFEKAESQKQKLASLDKFQSKSLVVNPNKVIDTDVFSIISDENYSYVNFLKIKNGAIIHTQSIEIAKKLDETEEEILTLVAFNLRDTIGSNAPEIITNLPLNISDDRFTNTIPKIGDKKKLLSLSQKNVLYYKKEKIQQRLLRQGKDKSRVVLEELQQVLRMKELPRHIECFDNSNIQGIYPVASMVFFRNGFPYKKGYRHFNIKTVVGPDDFASMKEIVHRRYKRLLYEKAELPQLIVIDGGKGQLSAACEALKELDLYGEITIIGIAKKLEEIYFPEDSIPLHISKKSPALKLLQKVRDEAHRFAIEFHRNKRSNDSLHSELEAIEGVGEKTITSLLRHFKTVNNVAQASTQEIAKVVGKAKANLIRAYFESKEQE